MWKDFSELKLEAVNILVRKLGCKYGGHVGTIALLIAVLVHKDEFRVKIEY